MGLFGSKKPSIASMLHEAYVTKETVGSCHVPAQVMNEVWISSYDQHKELLLELAKHCGTDEIPIRYAYDLASRFQPSVGVWVGIGQVGWVLKSDMDAVIEELEKLPKGSSIVGHMTISTGLGGDNLPYAKANAFIYADIGSYS